MTYHIVYHRIDLDGIASGSIVYKKLIEKMSVAPDNIKLVPYDYEDPTDWIRDIKVGDTVYMVDISLPRTGWGTLLGVVGAKIVWIDHHVTAIDDYLGKEGVKGWREEFSHLPSGSPTVHLGDSLNRKAGCYLTWEHFEPGKPIPPLIRELSNFDIWDDDDKTRWDSIVMPIHHIMGLIWSDPKDPPSYAFDEALKPDVMTNLIGTGKLLYDADKKRLRKAAGSSFETKFQDLPAIALNSNGQGSLSFDGVYDPAKHKIMVSFHYSGRNKIWKIGLYSTHEDVHCGKLAKIYGGGGHKGAAGFSVQKLSDAFPKYF